MRLVPAGGGWLEVVCGPMFSGKSEELLRRLRRAEIAGQRVGLFKPSVDDRFGTCDVVSHAGARRNAQAVGDPDDLSTRAEACEVVGIDEIQFFPTSIVPVVRGLVAGGRRVVVSGLDLDYRARPFGAMPELLAVAEFVDKLQAVCHRCGGAATLTQRLVDGRPAPLAMPTVVIGAEDQYEARCRACYRLGPRDAALAALAAPA